MARLTRREVGPNGSVFSRDYGYDAVGNVQTIADPFAGQTQSFGYDHRDRLTSAAATGGTTGQYNEGYAYDLLGNLTSKAGVAYAYPAPGPSSVRPHAPTRVGGAAYAYDANGNRTGRGADSYGYDQANRLTSATVGGAARGYSYDGDGKRAGRTTGGASFTNTLLGLGCATEGALPPPTRAITGAPWSDSGYRTGAAAPPD